MTHPLHNNNEKTEVIYGIENIIKRDLQAISTYKQTEDLCTDSKGLAAFLRIEPMRKAYYDLKQRGVKIRFVTEIMKENLLCCKEVLNFAQLRHLEGIKANFAIHDRIEYTASASLKEGKSTPIMPRLIYSNVKEIVELHQYLFETLWDKAIPSEQKIGEIEEGIKPDVIEPLRNPLEIQNLHINLIKSSTNEIMLIIPTTNAVRRQASVGILQLLKESAIHKKVSIRILAPLNSAMEQKINSLLSLSHPKIQVRDIETSSGPKSTVLIVDRKESLITEVKEDSKETFSDAIGLSTYSNSISTVLSYVSIFESFWIQSELYKKVKETEQMQRDFINIAAHELRNPIQPILALTEILRNKATDNEQRELLDVVVRSVKKLKQLTEDVLDVTRIESQSLQLHKERFNLSEMILNAFADFRNQSKKEYKDNIKLELVSKEDIFIEADKGRMYQVISNLLNNAIKFTNEGTIITTVEKKDSYVIISIKDSGTGIDSEIFPRLFSKFATKSEITGTGLGLFISKSIIESHGGRIWAENNKDGEKGATFHFSLPLSK
ncbi:MAG TPA: HAMP domain-containing sensor histidine kinase [Nitrososphaeraceae archaeon]|nr:HAMP domain-containing sensor histidine kinase [Nitrososphaeraceae archaeon]